MKAERANRLYELRREKRMTQTAVAIALNMSQSSLSDYEWGKKTIYYDTMRLFADFYGVSMDYIMKKTNDRTGVSGIGLNDKERHLVSIYRHLNVNYQKLLEAVAALFESFSDGL